jgi:hypothetical protein
MGADPSEKENKRLDNHNQGTYPFNAICCKPMEGLDEEEQNEHKGKRNIKFISEDRKGQQRFRDEEPQTIIKALKNDTLNQ